MYIVKTLIIIFTLKLWEVYQIGELKIFEHFEKMGIKYLTNVKF